MNGKINQNPTSDEKQFNTFQTRKRREFLRRSSTTTAGKKEDDAGRKIYAGSRAHMEMKGQRTSPSRLQSRALVAKKFFAFRDC
jgi:hypothetical protein